MKKRLFIQANTAVRNVFRVILQNSESCPELSFVQFTNILYVI